MINISKYDISISLKAKIKFFKKYNVKINKRSGVNLYNTLNYEANQVFKSFPERNLYLELSRNNYPIVQRAE